MNGIIFAIDPGNTVSGWCVAEYGAKDIERIIDKGKDENAVVLSKMAQYAPHELAIEMVASYGMPVGFEVFDTCVWIGKFIKAAECWKTACRIEMIYRKDEKLCLCGTMQAKDANIRQALADRYAPGEPNFGKGSKRNPGFFYGFSADAWSAAAIAATYYDKYVQKLDF